MPTLLMNDRSVAGLKSKSRTAYYDEKTVGLALRVGRPHEDVVLRLPQRRRSRMAEARRVPGGRPRRGAHARPRPRHDHRHQGHRPGRRTAQGTGTEPTAAPAFTFADFVPVYVAFQKGRTKDWENEAQKIARHLLPAWGPLPLKSITRTHVHDLLDTVTGKGLTLGVNRIQALISRMFTVALDRQLVDAHPAVAYHQALPGEPARPRAERRRAPAAVGRTRRAARRRE